MMSPTEILGSVFALIYAITMTLLALQGAHLLWMLGRWWRHRGAALRLEAAEKEMALPADEDLPRVLVQLPVYNERDMVDRLVDAVAKLDWPQDRLSIQLLDDSTDDSVDIGQAAIKRLQDQGFTASYLHRVDRVGFKAGALDAGMDVDDAPFIAIFDADFVPDPTFLRRAMVPSSKNKISPWYKVAGNTLTAVKKPSPPPRPWVSTPTLPSNKAPAPGLAWR